MPPQTSGRIRKDPDVVSRVEQLTPAECRWAFTYLADVVDRELEATVSVADAHWRRLGYPLHVREALADLLTGALAGVRAEALAVVHAWLMPSCLH